MLVRNSTAAEIACPPLAEADKNSFSPPNKTPSCRAILARARIFWRRLYVFLCPSLPSARASWRNSLKSIIPFWDYTTIGYIIEVHMSRSIYSKDYKEIIERLKKARVEADLSQQAVADKLGKPQSYISKIESGERRLDVAEMKKFAAIYNKPADFFLK